MFAPGRMLASILGVLVLWSASAASAQTRPPEPDSDLIVLSGDVRVRRGEEANEVIVLHGSVSVAGVVRGDVVLIDGRIEVTGQVGGSVVNVDGPVALGPSAHVGGDVLAHGGVRAEAGAQVDGDIRQGAAFTFPTPVRVLGRFAPWLAIWMSVLGLGLLLLLFAPRAADAVSSVARTRPWPSLGWGALVFVALPVGGGIAVLTLVGIPLGLGLLLALFLLYSIGLAWSALALGRLLWSEPRGRVLAFAIGWAIMAAVAAIPFVGGVVWLAGAIFGVGTAAVATWRARGAGGRHRPGGKMPVRADKLEAGVAEPTVVAGQETTSVRHDEGVGL